MKFFDQASVHA